MICSHYFGGYEYYSDYYPMQLPPPCMNPIDLPIDPHYSTTQPPLVVNTTFPSGGAAAGYSTFSPMASSSSVSSDCPTPTDISDGAADSIAQLKEMLRKKSETAETKKPSCSYVCLITMAIEDSPEKMLSLSEIYNWITRNFPYYEKDKIRWQNSVRHCLSFNDCFVTVKRPRDQPGKGNYWKMHDQCKGILTPASFMRRDKRFKLEGRIKKRPYPKKNAIEQKKKTENDEKVEEKVDKILHKNAVNAAASSLLVEILKPTPLPIQIKPTESVVLKVLKEAEVKEEAAAPTTTPLPPLTAPSGVAPTSTLTYILEPQPQYYMAYQTSYPPATEKSYGNEIYTSGVFPSYGTTTYNNSYDLNHL